MIQSQKTAWQVMLFKHEGDHMCTGQCACLYQAEVTWTIISLETDSILLWQGTRARVNSEPQTPELYRYKLLGANHLTKGIPSWLSGPGHMINWSVATGPPTATLCSNLVVWQLVALELLCDCCYTNLVGEHEPRPACVRTCMEVNLATVRPRLWLETRYWHI